MKSFEVFSEILTCGTHFPHIRGTDFQTWVFHPCEEKMTRIMCLRTFATRALNINIDGKSPLATIFFTFLFLFFFLMVDGSVSVSKRGFSCSWVAGKFHFQNA